MKKFFKISFIVILVVSLLAVSGGLITYASITKNAKIDNTLLPKDGVSAAFYSENGKTIEGFADNYVDIDEIPAHLKNAVIALEDKRFYKHNGVDYVRLIGATVNNIKKKSLSEGGSTITQQLIKNTHLTQEKTINRKLNEIKLARQLEKSYTKEEILTMYLNVVYFGNGMYGAASAAKGIFNKSVSDLSLPECAALAAILKNPSKYSPIANIDNSTERRNLVLSLMEEQGYISADERVSAQNTAVTIDRGAYYTNTQSYMLSAAYEAAQILNVSLQSLLSSDYVIETYLNEDCQQSVTDVIGNPSYYLINENGVRGEGLAIIIDNKTAGVQAYFSTKKRNIYDFSRPFGSIVKPILVYAPALEYNVITPATPVVDEKTDFSGYVPENYGDTYLGQTDIREAVKVSSNVVAVKTYNAIGFERVQKFAESVGISLSTDDNNATVALGNLSGNNGFLDILGAYCTLSNNGQYVKPAFVKTITDKNGVVVYQRNAEKTSVLSPENSYLMTDMLMDVANGGTAKGLSTLNFEIAAKTGTVGNTFGNTDAYNAGYTTDKTYLVWHGNSTGIATNDLPLKETGGSYVTRSAKDILKSIYTDYQPAVFSAPQGVIVENIDLYAKKHQQLLLLATDNTPAEFVKAELFSVSNVPTQYSVNFDNFGVNNMSAELSNGAVLITFDNAPYMYYDVYRISNNKEKLITTIKPTEDKIEYVDYGIPHRKVVKYSIKPYFYNQNGKKIIGNTAVTDIFYLKSGIFDFLDND